MKEDGAEAGQEQAQAALAYLLATAVRRLSGLREPVVVAACPNKFDDIAYNPDWLGVQVGRAMWERTDYRLCEGGDVRENARNPDDLHAARDVLGWLQDAAWRPLVGRAFGVELWDEVLAVVVQHGAPWFLVSASNAGRDMAFRIGAAGRLERVGEAERLDQRLGHHRPLLLERIDPAAWSGLHAAVPAFPAEKPIQPGGAEAQDAYARVVQCVRRAFSKLRAVSGTLRYAASARGEPDRDQWSIGGWRGIALDGFQASCDDRYDKDRYADWLRQHGAGAEALDRVLNELEAAKWRDLFSGAVMPLTENDSLAVLVRGPGEWLIAAQCAVFALTPDGGLDLVGACDRITRPWEAGRAVIHLFDGRSVAPPQEA